MFLRFLKEFFLKRKLKNSFANVKPERVSGAIRSVGLLLDESYLDSREAVLDELAANGIERNTIQVLAFRDRIRKQETFDYPVFGWKDISWSGAILKQDVNTFSGQPFDLLVSYYDIEKTPLMLVTQQSKAAFKAGFSTVDKRLNHLTITTVAENHPVFVTELFRYLKILQKI